MPILLSPATWTRGDLSTNRERFPGGKGSKPITTKSELLFVWLILDLLRVGGRGAVIVPDGVLFGNTTAHRELRRQLLFENTLEAVVSLPANMFQPYSGVKTSILAFQKARTPDGKPAAGDPPRTAEVWFYEIEDEAYSLDQKRKARTGQENDLWDALVKFHAWKQYLDGQAEEKPEKTLKALRDKAIGSDYWQPEYWEERWRNVDDEFLKIFPEKAADKDHTFGLHEIWPELPRNPRAAEARIVEEQRPVLEEIFSRFCIQTALAGLAGRKQIEPEKVAADAEKAARNLLNRLTKMIREENLLDREFDQFGLNALRPLLDEMKSCAVGWAAEATPPRKGKAPDLPDLDNVVPELRAIARQFARLDGCNVWLRAAEVKRYEGKLQNGDDGKEERRLAHRSWIVPVRVWAERDTWGTDPETGEEIARPTHNGQGLVRPDYLEWLRDRLKRFDTDGTVKKDFLDRLDPECIEALDFNLSAGRHKPFTCEAGEHQPPAELIAKLDAIHAEIRGRLGKLLRMVEGKV